MKEAQKGQRFFFIDETGDTTFYDRRKHSILGTNKCSRTFGIGFVRTNDAVQIPEALAALREEIRQDQDLMRVCSVPTKTLRAFHAKDDCPEVRRRVFATLQKVDFAFQVVVARKIESMFIRKFRRSEDAMYAQIVSHLLERQLHLSAANDILFAQRGSKKRQYSLRQAVERGVQRFRTKYPRARETEYTVDSAFPSSSFGLQAVDYMLWAVQRAFEKGEMVYFDLVREKVEMVWDIYDFEKINRKEAVIYDRLKNPFRIDIVSPLG